MYIHVWTIRKNHLVLCLKTPYSARRKPVFFKPHLICIYKEWWLLSWASNYELRIAGWSVTQWPPMSLANGCAKCSKVETDLQRQFRLCCQGDGGLGKWNSCPIEMTHHRIVGLEYLTQITHSSPNTMCDELISYLFVYV